VLKERDVIAGRYRLDSPIGEGAMGAVWRAEDQTLKRQIAIKFLFVKGSRDPQGMVDQFLREARIAASVQHRNVIHTVDFGTVDDFQPFMVMELLNGESLGDRMARKPALSSEQLIHIISLTLRGLSAVHDAGIVHRDLKPHNVFLQRDADAVYPKILDFGISRSLNGGNDRPSAIATQEGLIIGTPDYMSPEQARGELNIDRRADIYSMGAIIFEGLTGRLPYVADTIGDLIVQIVTTEPPRASDVAPNVPKPMSDLVAQAMSKNREHRFTDARAMRRALLAAAEASWSRGGRIAASVPPAPVQGSGGLLSPPPKAPSPLQQSAWGDFEGMEAPRIRDNNPPPAHVGSPAPQANPQRLVAHSDDPLLELPPAVPPDAPIGAPSPPVKARGRTRSASAAARDADLLAPMHAGGDDASLDLDYVKIKAAPKVARERPNAAARARAMQRDDSGGGLGSFLMWLVPIAVLALGGYLLYGPQKIDAASLGATPPDASGEAAEPIPGAARARRENPGTAPPHMRDVVF
jgi:serine/threonine protein kinase